MSVLKGWPGWRSTAQGKAPSAYMLSLGLKSHAGLILGGGTSADPVTTAVASQKMASFYTQNSATSGESYAFYWKHKVTGIGASATVARFYGYGNVAMATLQGAQITAEIGAAGTISGLCCGARAQLTVGADHAAFTEGTYCGGQSEIYFAGAGSSSTDLSSAAAHCIHRFIVDGDATARAKVKYLFEIKNVSAGTSDATKLINTANITASHGLNVRVNDEDYCLLLDKK